MRERRDDLPGSQLRREVLARDSECLGLCLVDLIRVVAGDGVVRMEGEVCVDLEASGQTDRGRSDEKGEDKTSSNRVTSGSRSGHGSDWHSLAIKAKDPQRLRDGPITAIFWAGTLVRVSALGNVA